MKNHLRPKRGSSDGRLTSRRVSDYKCVCALIHRDGMATGASLAGRGDSGAWAAHGDGDIASDGVKRGAAVQELPSGVEPGALVGTGQQPFITEVVNQRVGPAGSVGDGAG